MEEQPRKQGRPRKDPSRQKKNRTISLTDAEWKEMGEKAAAANRGISEYIIEQCGITAKD
ncbi:hypothetical protein [Hymenobacter rigui]|uniref:hypothetical protein n=1 Tax=Hymenobacter rigui TaxID=334424 RepID=UPI0011CF22E3|nr:hypothetical protein [Hymenobacter rigui]